MEVTFKFENGVQVKDLSSGLVGIINGGVNWLNGCKQYSVQPQSKDGEKKPESWWVDEQALEQVGVGISGQVEVDDLGGPSTRSPQ